MANRHNLNILPVIKQGGKTLGNSAGLMSFDPPRRSPRRRNQERLLLHLYLEGNAPLSDTAMEQLLNKLSEVYYQTDGSTTSALRNVTDVLNKYLLDRNYRAATKGLKAVGYLTQVVLREDRILYAQCGPSFIYHLAADQVEDLHDPDLSGSGLGLGKSFKVRYHQIALQPGQVLILTPEVPDSWNDNLFKSLARMNTDALVERLLHKLEGDLETVLIFPSPGDGEIQFIQSDWDRGLGTQIETPPIAPPASEAAVGRPDIGEPAAQDLDEVLIDLPEETADPDYEPVLRDIPPAPGRDRPAPTRERPAPTRERPAPAKVTEGSRPGFASRVAEEIGPALNEIRDSKTWSAVKGVGGEVGGVLKKGWYSFLGLVSKALPDDQLLDLPSWSLSLIAILVPVVMVIFGSVFYIKRGRNQLYEEHLSSAQTLLALAQTQLDTPEYYQSISQAMEEIEAARSYQQTDEVEGLFSTLRMELDTLDHVSRLDYQPLFSRGLGADVTISKVVVTAWNDLYMLNADKGSVIWAQSNPDGYRIIDDFNCGPIDGHIPVGPLVDIVPLPASQEDQATILAIDKNHTMMFCYADLTETPVIFQDTSYTLGRGGVQAITMASSAPYNLYILDPEKRAIWIEYQSQNYHEGSEYFGATDSPEMADAVDLVTSGSELFILHKDGYITKCVTERADSDPLCTTPFEYSDPRPGHESGPFFQDAEFDSFTIKGSPGMAVYFLDKEDNALYRFSTQLEFQEQFRPADDTIQKSATAFTVTMSDRVFLAVDDQVYTSQLLP